ncbi:MAG: IS200/IS605 family transposase [Bradymonadaceae bacterium]
MSYTDLNYHVVFATEGRQNLVTDAIRDRLYDYIGGIVRNLDGRAKAIGGTADHVHLLASLHQTTDVSTAVRDIKSNSSTFVNDLDDFRPTFAWQTKYAAFTVSRSRVSEVVEYIENQREHHRTRSFAEELVVLLERHDIDYDEEYLWE